MSWTTLITVAIACMVSGVLGGLIAQRFPSKQDVGDKAILRTHRLEIIDADGRVRAVIGSDKTRSFFEMLSDNQRPVISMGVPHTASQNAATDEPDIPWIEIQDEAGAGQINLSVDRKGSGRMVFGHKNVQERVVVGRFLLGDAQPDPESYGGWGILVNGRDPNGRHLGTAVGISTKGSADDSYMAPVTH